MNLIFEKYIYYNIQIFCYAKNYDSLSLQKLMIFGYFFNYLSLFSKLFLNFQNEIGCQTVFYTIYSLNPFNLLSFLKSNNIYMIFLSLFMLFLLIISLYLPLYIFIFTKYLNKKWLFMMNSLIKLNLTLFFWVGNTQFFNFFTNYIDEDWYSFYKLPFNVNYLTGSGLAVTNIIGGLLTIYLTLIFMIFNVSYSFIENELKFNTNICWLIIQILRILSFFLFPYLKNEPLLLYFLILTNFILVFFHLIVFLPCKNKEIGMFYCSNLFLCINFIIVFTFKNYVELILDLSFIYTIIISSIFAYKLGGKIYSIIFNKTIISLQNSNIILPISSLENIKYFYKNIDIFFSENKIFLLGMINYHLKNCRHIDCLTKKKEIFNFNNDFSKTLETIINKFIEKKFLLKFEKERNPIDILKFINFLIESERNHIKCFYYLEKLQKLCLEKQQNWFFKPLIQNISKEIITNLKYSEQENEIEEISQKNNNKLSLKVFLRIKALKEELELDVRKLLLDKRLYWDKYLNATTSMKDLLVNSIELTKKLSDFSKKLLNLSITNNENKIILLKYEAIYHGILVNSIDKSYKADIEYNNYLKQHHSLDDKTLSLISLLDANTATCFISFLKNQACLIEHDKNQKLAELFGYSLQEFQNIKFLDILLPDIISQCHNKLITKFVERGQNRSESKITSFAKNKNGFVFPLKIYSGLSHFYKNDFVMGAALIKYDDEINSWLFDIRGNTLGFSEGLFQFLHAKFRELTTDDVYFMNIFSFLPDLLTIIANELPKLKTDGFFKSRSGKFLVPDNLEKAIEKLKLKKREESSLKYESLITFNQKDVTITLEKRASAMKPLEKKNLFSANFNSSIRKLKIFSSEEINERNYIVNDADNLNIHLVDGYIEEFMIQFDLTYYIHEYGTGPNDNIQIFNANFILNQKENQEDNEKVDPIDGENIFIANLPNNNKPKFIKKVITQRTQRDSFELTEKKPLIINKIVTNNNIDIVESHSKDNDYAYTNKKENPLIMNDSSCSSSLNIAKKSSSILKSINTIQNNYPISIKQIAFFKIMYLFLIALFCSILSSQVSSYNSDYFIPLQKSLVRFCKYVAAISYSTATTIELDYKYLNITDYDNNIYSNYMDFLKYNFDNALLNIYEERNLPPKSEYQQNFHDLKVKILEHTTLKIVNIYYLDLIDYYLNTIIDLYTTKNFSSIDYKYFITLQRNYPYYLLSSATLFNIIQQEFLNSNTEITNNIVILLICYLMFNSLFVFYIVVQKLYFRTKIMNMLKILTRVTLNDGLKEIAFYEEMIKTFNEASDKYMSYNYSEICLSKEKFTKNDSFILENLKQESIKNAKKDKKTKNNIQKKHLYDIKPLSKWKIFVFNTVLFLLASGYAFSNYSFWVNSNETFKKLIEININFQNLYIYSSSIFAFSSLLLREKAIDNPEYNLINETYQNKLNRLSLFESSSRKRIFVIENVTVFSLPPETITASAKLKDKTFDRIINSNVCEVLLEKEILLQKHYNLCENAFNNAFKKGLINALSEFVSALKIFIDFVGPKKEKSQELLDYIQSTEHKQLIISAQIIQEALILYYSYTNQYYDNLRDEEINNLNKFIEITTAFFIIGFFLSFVFSYFKMKYEYKYTSFLLSIIPLEKMINDDQTMYLINKFSKEN